MKRRDFSLGLGSAVTAGAWMLPVAQVQAQTNKPKPGDDYLVLDKPLAVETPPGKVEVVDRKSVV